MKFKASLAILSAMLMIVALALVGCGTSSKDAYESFSLVMDKLAGPGQWSAAGHEDQLKDGTLIVKGVSLKLPPLEMPPILQEFEDDAEEGEDGAPKAAATVERTVNIAAVEVKNLAPKNTIAAIAALEHWRGQKETKLAASVVLKGVTYQVPMGSDLFEISIGEIKTANPVLGASDASFPEGLPGFVKACRADSLGYKNFKMTGLSSEAKMDAVLAEMLAEKVAFEGEPFSAFDVIDPSGMTGIMMGMSYKSAVAKNFSMEMEALDKTFKASMSADSLEQKDTKGLAIGHLKFSGLKFEMGGQMDEEEEDIKAFFPVSLSLGDFTLNGLDMNAYFQKLGPVIVASVNAPDSVADVLGQMQTLGDFFVSPISLKDISMSGFSLQLGEALSIKLAETSASGPYVAGQIPRTQKSSLKGLEVVLPSDPKFATGQTENLYKFGRDFGMTTFVVNAEGDGSYNPETGLLVSRTTSLSVKDLFNLTAEIEMGGLTQARIDTFNNTPLQMALMAFIMAPDSILGDVSLNGLKVKIEDHGFTDRTLALSAAKASAGEGKKIEVEEMRKKTIDSINSIMVVQAGEVLANPEVLQKALVAYYTQPKSLELSLKAEPSLSFKSAIGMEMDKNKILDSLNIRLSANGEEAAPFKFAIDGE